MIVKDIIAANNTDGVRSSLFVANESLYFAGLDVHGIELWKSDGTRAGTTIVKDIRPGGGSGFPIYHDDYNYSGAIPFFHMASAGNSLFFRGFDDEHGTELWTTDGTAAGTRLVKDIEPDGVYRNSVPSYLTSVDGTVYFRASNLKIGVELWKSDGTESGTAMVKDIRPGSEDRYGHTVGRSSFPHALSSNLDMLLFAAYEDDVGAELWSSDGSEEGTHLVSDISPGVGSSYPRYFTGIGGIVYFVADDSQHGQELWKLVNTGTDIAVLDATTTDFQRFDVEYSISESPSRAFILRAYLSADENFDPGFDQPLPGQLGISDEADRKVSPVGEPYKKTVTLTHRAPINEVQRFVIIVADPDGGVEEINEFNNATFAVPLFFDGEKVNGSGDLSAETDASASGAKVAKIERGTPDFNRLRLLPWPFAFSFQEDEPPNLLDEDHLGQPSLVGPVARLVQLIGQDKQRNSAVWNGYTFSINEAFDSFGEHGKTRGVPDPQRLSGSLHYEGRAIDFDPIPPNAGQTNGTELDLAGLRRFSGLAWLAGFDWVYNEHNHVHVSVRESIRNAPLGDTNGDGRTDVQDLNNVRNNFGASGLHNVGDSDGNASVGIEDLNAVRNNFGATTAPLTTPQPFFAANVPSADTASFDPLMFEHRPLDDTCFNAAVDRIHEADAVVWQRGQEATTTPTTESAFMSHRRSRRLLTI